MLWPEINKSLNRIEYTDSGLPVSLDLVKSHARIATDIDDFDTVLITYVYAAEKMIEDAGLLIRNQTWRLTFQTLPHVMSGDFNVLPIHIHPVPVITSVKYRKTDRTQVSLTEDDQYRVYGTYDPILLGIDCGSSLITDVSDEMDAWEVEAAVSVDEVPEAAKCAIAVACAYWFRNPEAFANKQFDKSTNLAFDGLVNSLSRRIYS